MWRRHLGDQRHDWLPPVHGADDGFGDARSADDERLEQDLDHLHDDDNDLQLRWHVGRKHGRWGHKRWRRTSREHNARQHNAREHDDNAGIDHRQRRRRTLTAKRNRR